jgi:hypothetical protein
MMAKTPDAAWRHKRKERIFKGLLKRPEED